MNEYFVAACKCQTLWCANLSIWDCPCATPLLFSCLQGAWGSYTTCRLALPGSATPYLYWNIEPGPVDPCQIDLDEAIVTAGTFISMCWSDSNDTAVPPAAQVTSVELYMTTEAAFQSSFAVDSLLSSVNFQFIGNLAPVPTPDTGAAKRVPCGAWAAALPTDLQADTTYRLVAQIHMPSVGSDSLDFATTTLRVNSAATDVDENLPGRRDAAAALRIVQARPNPFNPAIAFSFENRDPGNLRLDFYDLGGRHVRSLDLGHLEPGRHEARWNGRDDQGRDVGSGVYFVRLAGPTESSAPRKITLVR